MLLASSLLIISALHSFSRAAHIESLSDELLLNVLETDNYQSTTALACTSQYFHEFVSSESLNQILAYASSSEYRFDPRVLRFMVIPAFSFLLHPDTDAELVRSALASVITSWYQLNDYNPVKALDFPESTKSKVIDSNWDKLDQIGYVSLALSGYEGFSLVFNHFFFSLGSKRQEYPEEMTAFMKSIFDSHFEFFERKEQALFDLMFLIFPRRAYSQEALNFIGHRFERLTGYDSTGTVRFPSVGALKEKIVASNYDYLWQLIFLTVMNDVEESFECLRFWVPSWHSMDKDISNELSKIFNFFEHLHSKEPFMIPADWSAERFAAFSSLLRTLYRFDTKFSHSFVQKMLAANDEPSTKLLQDMLQDPNFERACIEQVRDFLLSLQDDQCIFDRRTCAGCPQIYSEVTVNGFNLMQKLHPDFLVDFVVKDLIKVIGGDDNVAAKYESVFGDCGSLPVIQMAMQTNDILAQNRDLLTQKLPKITSKIF